MAAEGALGRGATPADKPEENNLIPKPVDFFLTVPLYAKTPFKGMEGWEIVDALYYRGIYDSFCTKCDRVSTFRVAGAERPAEFSHNEDRERARRKLAALGGDQLLPPAPPPVKNGVYFMQAMCARDMEHRQDFIFLIENGIGCRTFEKIGQSPSYADLHLADVKQYAPVLTKPQLGELIKAIGLASHGVGIGSYVYLRRIFEALVEEAHKAATVDQAWDEDAYSKLRMNERISILKGHLPDFLVEHPGMYSILSKGIHELAEEDCLKHFATVRIGIEMILSEKLEQKNKESRNAAARQAIQVALGEVNGAKKAD